MKNTESRLTSLIAAFDRAYYSKYDTPKIFNDFIAKKFQDHLNEILRWITQV